MDWCRGQEAGKLKDSESVRIQAKLVEDENGYWMGSVNFPEKLKANNSRFSLSPRIDGKCRKIFKK